VILDSENLTGQLAAAAPEIAEQVTRQRPDLREVIERQVREPLERAVRRMDRTQPVLLKYRATLEESLSSDREDWVERAQGSYQRLTRLLVGPNLLEVAETLPPSRFPGYWIEASESVTGALADCQNANLPDSQETREQWALTLANDDSRDGWVEVVFLSSKGNPFRGYFPDRGDLREMVRWQERPATYLDTHLWAEVGLPQLVKRAAGSPARQHLESVVWSLRDYEKSGFP
jgi:hypothetical protein